MNNTTALFKLQHPEDLISRLFILEYIRELGVEKIKEKLTEGETKFWLYSFEGDNSEIVRRREAVIRHILSPSLLCAAGIRCAPPT